MIPENEKKVVVFQYDTPKVEGVPKEVLHQPPLHNLTGSCVRTHNYHT